MIFQGGCHCGAIKVSFQTDLAPDDIQVRQCQCDFCRRRGGKTVSDPEGRLEFRYPPGSVNRYRFGTSTADFLLCDACGSFIGVTMDIDGELFGVLNVVGADIALLANRPGAPMDYSAETLADRAGRRRRVWTPTTLVEA